MNTSEFLTYLRENGILSRWTPSRTPQLAGVSARRSGTLLDMVQSMTSFATLPEYFSGLDLVIACFILNRVSS